MIHPTQIAKTTAARIPATEDATALKDRCGEDTQVAQTKLEREKFFRKRQQHRRMKRRIFFDDPSVWDPKESR